MGFEVINGEHWLTDCIGKSAVLDIVIWLVCRLTEMSMMMIFREMMEKMFTQMTTN